MPTVLSLAGLPALPGLRGLDLAPAIAGDEPISRERAVFPVLLRAPTRLHLPMRRVAVQGDLKFIEGSATLGDPEGFLFDLAATPDESENLRAARPAEFRAFRELVEAHARSLVPGSPVHQHTGLSMPAHPGLDWDRREVSAEDRAKLEALGYLTPEG